VGASPLLLRDRRVRRFATHASWRTQVDVHSDHAELQIRTEGLASLVAELREEQEVAV